MPIIIFIVLSLSPANTSVLLKKITNISAVSHQNCLLLLPDSSHVAPAFSAFLCGENVTEDSLKEILIKSSLIHLFVVSGSHLLLLEEIFTFCHVPILLRFFLLGIYSLACGWQAPIARSALGFLLKFFFKLRGYYWPADLIILFTGFFTLLLFPDWTNSRSLTMSWFAALGLTLTSLLQIRHPIKKVFAQSAFVYFFMLPAIWGFGSLHPLAIVFNIFLAPFISFLLFPLAFFACLFKFLIPLFEKCFDFFLWLSRQCTEVIVIEKTPPLKIETLWLLLLSLHFFIHVFRLHIRRKRP